MAFTFDFPGVYPSYVLDDYTKFAAVSPVFDRMLKTDMEEKRTMTCQIKDIHPNKFIVIMKWLDDKVGVSTYYCLSADAVEYFKFRDFWNMHKEFPKIYFDGIPTVELIDYVIEDMSLMNLINLPPFNLTLKQKKRISEIGIVKCKDFIVRYVKNTRLNFICFIDRILVVQGLSNKIIEQYDKFAIDYLISTRSGFIMVDEYTTQYMKNITNVIETHDYIDFYNFDRDS